MLTGITDLRVLNRALRVDRLLVRVIDGAAHRRPVRVATRRAQAVRRLWAAVGKAGLQNEGLPSVGGEGLADRVDLFLHVGHRPGVHTFLQDPHVPREILPSVGVQIRVRRGKGDLLFCQEMDNKRKKESFTHQMKHDTRQNAVEREVDASLHALQTIEAERLQDAFLEATQVFGCAITQRHMMLPLSVHARRVQMGELRPVEQDEAELVVAVHVADEWRGQPRDRAIRWEVHGEVSWQVVHPARHLGIQLGQLGVATPILVFVDAGVQPVHPRDVADTTGEVGEVSGRLVVRIVARDKRAWQAKVHRVQIHRKISPTYAGVREQSPVHHKLQGACLPCAEPIMVSQMKTVCHIRVFKAQSAAEKSQGRPALWSS